MSVTFNLTSLVHTAANLIPTSILEWSAGNGETRLTKSATKMTLSSSVRIEGFRFEDENGYEYEEI